MNEQGGSEKESEFSELRIILFERGKKKISENNVASVSNECKSIRDTKGNLILFVNS